MAKTTTCDICGNKTDRIVMKLFMTPIKNGVKGQHVHSAYTGHADVGECCGEKMVRQVKWQPRKTRTRKN